MGILTNWVVSQSISQWRLQVMTIHWQWSWHKLYSSKLPYHRYTLNSCAEQHFGWIHLLRWSASCQCVEGYLVDIMGHFRRLFCGPMRDALLWTEEKLCTLKYIQPVYSVHWNIYNRCTLYLLSFRWFSSIAAPLIHFSDYMTRLAMFPSCGGLP